METIRSSQVVVILLVAFAIGAGNLLVPTPAPAAEALFRVERKFFSFPFPPVTTKNGNQTHGGLSVPTPNGLDYGGAGRYIAYVFPYFSNPPGKATVKAGNFVGSPFTLPESSAVNYVGTGFTRKANTGFPGYTTIGTYVYHNAIGRFGPSFGATTPTRIVFPTSMGNSTPNPANTKNINTGSGNPITPTTTFNGNYDFSRVGSLQVTPGPNRFGGTMRMLNGPDNRFYQFNFKYSPTSIFKVYGTTICQRAGEDCTADPSGPFGPSEIGSITNSAVARQFLLNQNKSTGTGMRVGIGTAKATIATTNAGAPGTYPTVNGQGTPVDGNPASYRAAKINYMHLLHPWTTGAGSAYNYEEGDVTDPQTAMYVGYDTSLMSQNLTITRIATNQTFDSTANTIIYSTSTYKQYLTGVKRVVSLVRPRLVHVYKKPIDTGQPFISNYQSARVWTMRVFFVPEPMGLTMIGVGIAALLGLSRMRRR